MKRPLAYITAPWSNSQYENAENAAAYCRQVYDAGYSPICPVLFLPTFLKDEIPQEHKDGLDISQDNKAWAKAIPTLEDSGASRHCAYLVVDQVNPGLTDLFTRQFRKVAQEQQKSSVLQKLKQEPPARKPATPKKREPER